MTNKELQQMLAEFPPETTIKIMVDHRSQSIHDFDEENILFSSETAYVDSDAPEDEWDSEGGKIELGDGKRYLLLNPIVV